MATANKTMSATKVVIPCRISFANIFEPKSINGSEAKYSVSCLIPKTDKKTLLAIHKAIEAAKEDGKTRKWSGKIPPNLKMPLRDGDIDRPDDENYQEHFFLNATSKDAPQVVDRHVQPMYVVRLEELRCRLIFSSEDRAWERYTRLREKGQQAAMPKVTSDESRKTLLKAITWKYDWIQQHKKQCFRFAEAVYARQMKDETSQSRFIEAFIQYAANLPEPNRRLLDEMYELAWYDIQLYPCSLEGKRLVKPWYDTKESGDGKC